MTLKIRGDEMRRIMMVWFVLLATGCAVAASAVAALPVVLLLPTESGSLLLKSLTNSFATSLETETSHAIKGEGVLIQLHFPNVTSNLGQYEVLFTKVRFGNIAGQTCNSTGDLAEEVLWPKGTFHLVFDSLTVLGVAALLLIPEFSFLCKTGIVTTVLVGVIGQALMLVYPLKTEVLVGEEFRLTSRCNAGVPVDTAWWDENGGKRTARLSANVGAGFESACVQVSGTVLLSTNRMAELMG
jgi:hypothetical protein